MTGRSKKIGGIMLMNKNKKQKNHAVRLKSYVC